VRVPSNGCGLFPEVQREDRESARGVVAVKLLEDRQLGPALETPGRSNIEKDHAALQTLQTGSARRRGDTPVRRDDLNAKRG
jgi:hypothetical protein